MLLLLLLNAVIMGLEPTHAEHIGLAVQRPPRLATKRVLGCVPLG